MLDDLLGGNIMWQLLKLLVRLTVLAGLAFALWFWFLEEPIKELGIPEQVAITVGILTLNGLFSWQLIGNLNRLSNMAYDLKKIIEKIGIDKSEEDKKNLERFERYLSEWDLVYGAHASFTLGVLVPVIALIFLIVIHYGVSGVKYTYPRGIGFAYFFIGYFYLVRSSVRMYLGKRDYWSLWRTKSTKK